MVFARFLMGFYDFWLVSKPFLDAENGPWVFMVLVGAVSMISEASQKSCPLKSLSF